jgi:GT2 family glycosyltransferase
LFETAADNVGFLVAKGQYFLEIQADMQIFDYGYNERLQRPFQINPSVVGMSGRCVYTMTNGIGIGKLGATIEKPLDSNIQKNGYFVGETCNRGPLLLDAVKVRELGYLDERHFFLDDSDHDFFFRAFQKGWVCGYVPVEVISILCHGSTRKSRDPLNKLIYQQLLSRPQHESFLWKSLSVKPVPRPIVFIPY